MGFPLEMEKNKENGSVSADKPASKGPDGGWGWMVVTGAALINMVNQAMFANYGLIFGEHLKQMAGGHATGITAVMAVSVVVTNFAGLLVGPLLKKFSIRTVTFFAIALVGNGMIVSSFSTEIWHIAVGYGCLTGLGLGILASGTFLAINDYFTTKKSTAVGIAMAGTGVGQMVMPTFIGMLLKKYEFSGTTFILGLLSYTGVIGAMFFKPIFCCKHYSETKNSDIESVGTKQDENCNVGKTDKPLEKKLEEEETLLKSKKANQGGGGGMIRNATESNFQESLVETANSQALSTDETTNQGCLHKVARAIGLPLLRDLIYVHILSGLALGYVSTVTFSAFFPMFLQDEEEYSVMETTYCMTALSFADVVGRVTVSEICRRLGLGNRDSFMIGCILLAAARSILVELLDFKTIIIVSFIVGYFRSITVVNQNLVISEYIEKDKLPSAVGLNMVSKALFTMTFGQALGLLKDQISYGMCIHVLDVVLLIVVLSWSLEKVVKCLRK